MKKIILILSFAAFIIASSAEKADFTLFRYEGSDTVENKVTLASQQEKSVFVQGSSRLLFDYSKDTLYIMDDSAKTLTKMPVSLVGLFFSGLSGMSPVGDSSKTTVKKNDGSFEYKGSSYPQFSVYSNGERILSVAYDDESDYPYTRKSIDRLKKVVESFLGFDMQSEALKEIKGLPKAMIYYSEGKEQSRAILVSLEKGGFESLFRVPDNYAGGN